MRGGEAERVQASAEGGARGLHTLPLTVWNCIRMAALVSVLAWTFGSWTKFLPRLASGGSSPVRAILMHSMMVVLPEPLLPTIRVRGFRNAMT